MPNTARTLMAAALAGALAALPGCNIIAPIAAVAQGPGEVEAVFELDPSRKTVIFVDDPANKIAQRRTRATIGEACQQALMRKKKVRAENMIDTRSAIAAAANGDGTLAVTEIGEAVGAEIIVYALVTRFEMSGDGADFDPTAEVEVKVFDVTTHSRVWPPPGDPGYRSRFSGSGPNRYMPTTRTDQLRAQNELAMITGEGLSQLFYDVERPQSLRKQ
jgi:hypothetical protein